MCRACDLNVALGEVAAGNRKSGGATQPAASFALGRRPFVRGALALAGVALAPAADFASANAAQLAANDGSATTVFRNGAVYTLAPNQPWAQAVAISGSRIAAVGSDADMAKFTGPKTEVVDLRGRMLMPGFVEGHTHPFLGAFFAAGVDLQYPTRVEALAAIRDFARLNPKGVIRGFGWRMDMFPDSGPTREELDQIVSDRPVMLIAIDCHSMWVNSASLEAAGITKSTPDPIPGFSYFARAADGEPTGFVLEVPAVLQVVNAITAITVSMMATMLGEWLPKASAAGITTVFDAGVPPIGGSEAEITQIYADYEAKNALPFRVVACHTIKGPPIEDAVGATDLLRKRFNSELVQARVLKIVADGTAEGWTAHMLQPYADKPGFRGVPPFSQDQLNRMVAAADVAGIDVHVHACGDATVRMALDAFERAIETLPPRDRRNTIAHNVSVDDADIPRFAKLGVIAEFSINWHSMDPDSVDIILARCGPELQAKIYRPRSVLKSGGRISAGTDWPAAGYFSTYKPLESIQIGVTRQLIDRSADGVFLQPADERLELAEALAANTLGAAYQLRMERDIGSIEVGKKADLVVLDENLFKIPATEIARTQISMTMMNGRFTHRQD
jgi:predicted amidohydrolase YtcJ